MGVVMRAWAVLACFATGCGWFRAETDVDAAVTLAYSGHLENELEPCGCPKNPMGGLARRSQRFLDVNGPVVVVDAGGSFGKAGTQPGEIPQRQRKAEVIARGFQTPVSDAIVLSADDWALGADFVRGMVASHDLPVLAANLVCGGQKPFPGSRVVERAGRRIGIVGVTAGDVAGCVVEPQAAALSAAVAELGEVDLVIALLPGKDADTRAWLVPGIDLVVDSHASRQGPLPDRIGDAWVLGAGSRGHRVGLATLTFRAGGRGWTTEGAETKIDAEIARVARREQTLGGRAKVAAGSARERLDAQLVAASEERVKLEGEREALVRDAGGRHLLALEIVPLLTSLPEQPDVAAAVAAFLGKESTAIGVVPGKEVARVAPAGSPFAGAERCATCHEAIYQQWSGTAHARAWETLVEDGHAADEDCFSCHSTGAGLFGGPASPSTVAGLRDVQCEVCHGAAHAHLADPTQIKPRRDPPVEVCQGCHDGIRDGGRFNFEVYRPQIVHGTGARAGKGG